MSKELNCMNCCIGDFKHSLCDCDNGMCKEYKKVGRSEDFENEVLNRTKPKTEWIPVSDKLPKENEYVGNVCKYYLIQDEYGDMHVAHLSGRGWETIESVKALGCDVVAWMPLPEPYKGGEAE